MAVPSASTLDKPHDSSDVGSESEDDDDFVPEGKLSPPAAVSSKLVKAGLVTRDTCVDSDEEDSEDQDDEDNDAAAAGEEIDADELEALKRERAELVAAAGGEDRLGKRRRLAQGGATEVSEVAAENQEVEALKAKALAEWEAIKGSEAASSKAEASLSSSANGGEATMPLASESERLAQQDELISIPTTYKFAGEVHTSTRLLPRSHPEAIKHFASQAAATAASDPSTPPVASISSPAETSTATAKPSRPPPPGPRRKKASSLASLSAAATAKPTKLNTLEKSKLDWDSFKGDTAKLSRHELDELENQTKGGGKGLGDMKGYLERRDFLDRVKDRTGQP